jgi:AcrR family transcriptional regulator
MPKAGELQGNPPGTRAHDGHEISEKPQRERLTRARIVRAALRIMDAEGLEAVTMRRVGRELGVEAMSLYNHVDDKEDILHGVIEAVMGDFEFPEEAADWKQTAIRTAQAWRNLLKAHPNVITLMSEQRKPMTSPTALRPMEHALEVLRRAGLSEEETVRAFRAIGGYIQGFVLAEVANMFGGEEGFELSPEEVANAMPLEDLPFIAAHLPHLFLCDFDAEFEYGLDLMIRGLEAKTARP